MNVALIEATLRQRLTSPVRMVLLAMLLFMPLVPVAFAPQGGLASLGDCYGLTLVLAAGLIGQDLSAGVLQLLFARPVKRSEYVVSRWLAVSIGAVTVAAVQVALASGLLGARHHPAAVRDLMLLLGNNALLAFGTAAVVTLFSSLLPGFGDLALLLLFNIMGGVAQVIGRFAANPFVTRLGEEILGFITPRLDLAQFFTGSQPSWFAAASYFSTVTGCLALAIVVLNRREFSYASAG